MTGGVRAKRDKDLKGMRPALEPVWAQDRRLWAIRNPLPRFGCQTGRFSSLPRPHIATGQKHKCSSPQKPIQSTATWQTAPDRPPDSPSLPMSVPPLPGHAGPSQSQTFTVHTCLPQTVFVKYQCICCPGGVPNSSCTIHTFHSFFLSVFYVFCFFRFFFVKSPSRSKRNSSSSMILSSCCNRQPSERLSPKRGPGGTGFRCKTACFGWNSLPTLCSGTVQPETGRETASESLR